MKTFTVKPIQMLAAVALTFLSLTFFCATSAFAQFIDLPRTGQTTCYDSAGAVIACPGTGQDGEIQAGVPWPDPRFTVSTDGYCVTDNLTGLMWVRSPDSLTRTWQQALDYANGLTLCGYTDWRLPNVNELERLVHAGQSNSATWLNTQGFSNVQSNYYWSSTSSANSTNYAWVVNMWGGNMYNSNKSNSSYVWPVRSGQVGPLVHSIHGTVTKNSVGLSGVNVTLSGAASASTTTAADGTYSFPGLADGSFTVTPGLGGYTFTPADRSVTLSGADAAAQDFSATCVQNTYYRDADGDTYGDVSVPTQACVQPAGYVTHSSDCNDGEALINPGMPEICNEIDDNCNGQVDEGVQDTYYQDADSDTYGNASSATQACSQPSGYVSKQL